MSEPSLADFNHVNDKITEVKVSVARVESTTEDSNKRLAEVQTELKHAVKNWTMTSNLVAMQGEKLKAHDGRLDHLAETKADKEDLEEIRKDVEAGKKAVFDMVKKVGLWAGAIAFAYIINKLQISLPKL